MITSTEALILSLLGLQRGGAFGSQLMHLSEGKLKRGSVYALLGRLENAGYVRSDEEPPTEEYALPRTRYAITAMGVRARSEFAEWHGFVAPSFSLEVT